MELIFNLLKQNLINFREENGIIIIPSKNLGVMLMKFYLYSELAGKKTAANFKIFKQYQEKGIRLIQIFESEIFNNPKIVLTRIKSYLGLLPYNIYARKCEIREITCQLKNKFLNKYHIQGQDYGAGISLGIYYKNRLVSVASYIRKANGLFELSRFSGNSNFNVCGGASKVMSFFEKKYNPKTVVSFADKRWSGGNIYYKLNFKAVKENPPSYWYFKQNTCKIFHKFGFRRKNLPKKLDFFDEKFSEWENMKNNGWDRIWDCGIIKFQKDYI